MPVPFAPSAPTAAAGDTIATVTWLAPFSGSDPITNYKITPYIGLAAQPTVSTLSTSILIGGLTNGVTYTFKVAAVNVNGTGPSSPSSNAVIPVVNSPSATTITGLSLGVEYTFKVSAINLVGSGPDSLASNAVIMFSSSSGFNFPFKFPFSFG